jgi:hypothetical protein
MLHTTIKNGLESIHCKRAHVSRAFPLREQLVQSAKRYPLFRKHIVWVLRRACLVPCVKAAS